MQQLPLAALDRERAIKKFEMMTECYPRYVYGIESSSYGQGLASLGMKRRVGVVLDDRTLEASAKYLFAGGCFCALWLAFSEGS